MIFMISWQKSLMRIKIDIPCGKQTVIQVGIHGPDRYTQFGMIGDDLIRGLSLIDQGSDDLVDLPEIFLGDVNAGPCTDQLIPVFSVSKKGIVSVFTCNGTAVDLFFTAIADMGCSDKPAAFFHDIVFACLVACWTGSTFDAADQDLLAGIRLLAVIPMDTEVMGIVKSAFVVPVGKSVFFYLPGDGGGILTQIPGDLFEGKPFIQGLFNKEPVLKGKVFVVAGDKSAHIYFLPLLSEVNMNIPSGE